MALIAPNLSNKQQATFLSSRFFFLNPSTTSTSVSERLRLLKGGAKYRNRVTVTDVSSPSILSSIEGRNILYKMYKTLITGRPPDTKDSFGMDKLSTLRSSITNKRMDIELSNTDEYQLETSALNLVHEPGLPCRGPNLYQKLKSFETEKRDPM